MNATASRPQPILPPATLGMLGGGQLGRFFVSAAHEMGYTVWVLDPDSESPAGRIADRHLCAAYTDETALDEFAAACAAVSTEFENVPAATLEKLATRTLVRPSARAVSVCQDRIEEKLFVQSLGLACAPFAALRNAADWRAMEESGVNLFPGILKAARLGYDGKGQAAVEDEAAARAAWSEMGQPPCVLERRLALDCEISVILARAADGATQVFPVAENQHRNGILDISIAPARIGEKLRRQARDAAACIAGALDYVGTLAVEFFVSDGTLYVNEMAPRPHNSGHYTLDACNVSQYEQQVRALVGLPLARVRSFGASVMVNLLGECWQDGGPDWKTLYATQGVRVHDYGKRTARRGRKMAHFTVVGEDVEAVYSRALAVRKKVVVL
ncbi:MAG: 5-(carboxyamino)imidazole ribonucleotide synthase [Rhodocyclaceae bacterium]|nr:5-(carboxyamino)imidazole ribonucleotide synthase [Rhodocyclaceae bacterium]MBR4878032.1 5-(carboxyamino)imidazole ribonucleotide synthase [Rhodocyclaceae bacterium]